MDIDKSTLCRRMLNKLGMHLEKCHGYYYAMTDNGRYFMCCGTENLSDECLFYCVDDVDCLDILLKTKEFYIAFSSITTTISNPFYKKTLEEICIMLDLENI